MFFFLFPIGVDFRARRYPVVTFTLMGLCTLIYLAQLACTASGDDHAVDEWVFQYLWLRPDKSYWWTYLTAMFVHGGFFHLAGNMVYLFIFGSCVEDLIGRVRYTIFYLLCGLAADFSQILLSAEHFNSDIPFGGASGAIAGCIGGFLLLLAKSWVDFKWVFFFFFRFWTGNLRLPAWLVIAFFFTSDIMDMFIARLDEFNAGGVAFAAHVGGMAFGMGLIALVKLQLRRSGGLDWVEEEDEEPTVGVLGSRPAPQPSAAWHTSDMRVQPRMPSPAAAPVIVPVDTATIYLSWDGVNYGPYSLAQIQPMFKRG